jgi:hypothetical protein
MIKNEAIQAIRPDLVMMIIPDATVNQNEHQARRKGVPASAGNASHSNKPPVE